MDHPLRIYGTITGLPLICFSKKYFEQGEQTFNGVEKQIRNVRMIILIICLSVLAAGCTSPQKTEQSSAGTNECVEYEAIFLDNLQITGIFTEVRGEIPCPLVTRDFHVTTSYMPEKDARSLYGREVEVKIIGYKNSAVTDDDGKETHNEGLKVELYPKDEEMEAYLSAHPANYHITGSYEEHAKYTKYFDFSDMQPCEYTVTGRFGGCLYSGTIIYDAGLLDTPEADQKP